MLPENFDTRFWASNLSREMCFASQFFTFSAQFSEPQYRRRWITVSEKLDNGQISQKHVLFGEWLSLEHYATAHQHTQQNLPPPESPQQSASQQS